MSKADKRRERSERTSGLICRYEYPPADRNYWIVMAVITPVILFLACFAEDASHLLIYVGMLVLFWIVFLFQTFYQRSPDSVLTVILDKRVFRFERFRFRPHSESFYKPTFFRMEEQVLVPFDDVRDLQLNLNTKNDVGLRSLKDRNFFQRFVNQLEKSDGKFGTGRPRGRYLLLITSEGDIRIPLYGLQNRVSLLRLFDFLHETSPKAPIGISPIFAVSILLGIVWIVFAVIMLYLNWEYSGLRLLWSVLFGISCTGYVLVFIAASDQKRRHIRNANWTRSDAEE